MDTKHLITFVNLAETQNYLRGHSESNRSQYVGHVTGFDNGNGLAEVLVKNRFQIGDRLEIIHPSGNEIIELSHMLDSKGQSVQVAPGSGHRVRIPFTKNIENAFIVRFF